jgi:hypothetical protein
LACQYHIDRIIRLFLYSRVKNVPEW